MFKGVAVRSLRAQGWALLPLLFLALMLAVPLGTIVQGALFPNGSFSLTRLESVWSDPYFQRIARFTVWQAFLSALASAGLGLIWAYVLACYEFPLKRTLRALTVVPFVLPAVSLALGFVLVFGRQGLLNGLLTTLFRLEEPPVRLLYSLGAIVLAHAFYNAPIVARLVGAAWERIDPSYDEAARSLGAGRRATFRTVVAPLLLPALATGTALAFIYAFLSFPIVLTLGGARYATLEVAIYTETITLGRADLGAALALIQIVLSLAFTYGYLRCERRFSYPLETLRARPTVPLLRLGGDRPAGRAGVRQGLAVLFRLGLWGFLTLGGLFFAGPLLGVLWDSFRGAHGGWTLAWYGYVFRPDFDAFIGSSPLEAVVNSLAFGLGTMTLALALGGPLAWAIARGGWRWLNVPTMLPLAISSVALGFGLLRAFSLPPLRALDRSLAVVLAHSLLALPFVVRALVPALGGLDRSLAEAARSLGAGPWRAFGQIELPLLRGAVLAAAAFAFAISIGEMSATIMLAQPGLKTMPVAVYSFLGARLFGAASAMSALLIAVTALAFVLIERSGERVL